MIKDSNPLFDLKEALRDYVVWLFLNLFIEDGELLSFLWSKSYDSIWIFVEKSALLTLFRSISEGVDEGLELNDHRLAGEVIGSFREAVDSKLKDEGLVAGVVEGLYVILGSLRVY